MLKSANRHKNQTPYIHFKENKLAINVFKNKIYLPWLKPDIHSNDIFN